MAKYYIYTEKDSMFSGKWTEIGEGNNLCEKSVFGFCCRVDDDGRVYIQKSSLFTLYGDRPTAIYNAKRMVQAHFGVVPEFRKKI